MGQVEFSIFSKSIKPKEISIKVVEVFKKHIKEISTVELIKGLKSNSVLAILRSDLQSLGFEVEKSKRQKDKIQRMCFGGINTQTTLKFEIDAYNYELKCRLEVEAARAWLGNAVYRDLVQSLILEDLDHLIIAVPLKYKYKSNGKNLISKDYEYAKKLIESVYSNSKFELPYDLTLIGY